MAVKIKLKRMGKMRDPQYRIVVADARTKRDGRAIEEIGVYRPKEDPSFIEVQSERVQYWLGVGAQPTEAVAAILRVTGDWQSFKGEPAPAPMKVAEAKADKKSVFEAAVKSGDVAAKETPAPKASKTDAAAAEDAAVEAPAETPAPEVEAPADAEAPAEAPAAEATPEAAAPEADAETSDKA